ncbi:MAG: hypothetical protein ACYCT0_12355 [Sulfobacillus sp.]
MLDWTFNQLEADWMTERLKNFGDFRLASLAPSGFAAYGRLLHPAPAQDGTLVRWAEVASHNGTPMTPTSDFSHLAMAERLPDGGTAWMGDPPDIGTLESHQAEHLGHVLAAHTHTPDTIWFALWDGLGWDRAILCRLGHPPEPAPDPIPLSVRNGPRMRIPSRDYIVYSGSIEDALVWIPTKHQTPHFWWPQDHAWVVAGDVDLPWSIVAGSQALIDSLIHDSILEVVPISENDQLDSQPAWLTAWVEQAVRDLVAHRTAVIKTPRGAVSFRISDSGVWLESERGSRTRLHPKSARRTLEDQLSSHLLACLINELHLY